MTFDHFSDLNPPDIDIEAVTARYEALLGALAEADGAGQIAVVERWDALRRELETWQAHIRLRFYQDTRDAACKAAYERADDLRPRIVNLDVRMKRALLSSPERAAIEARFGGHAFDLWECDVAAFAPEIQEDMVKEARLKAAYTELRASAELTFQGQTHTLAGIARFALDPDPAVRAEAAGVKWGWYAEHGAAFDQIFHDLVQVRHKMAHALGYEDFVGLGYKLMQRVDYDKADVDRFRAQVRDHLVPLVAELRQEQADRLGLNPMCEWDEGLLDAGDPPKPLGDTPFLVEQARDMFKAMGDEPDAFYTEIVAKGLLDLDTRPGKGGGAFCTAFPDQRAPFVFGNFNGTLNDVRTFTHELGHAFQYWTSRDNALTEYLWPTYEACEIHSMGLEFLTLPHIERFFSPEDAERFRRDHLVGALMFIPYGVAVDHFQHLVYESPEATPEERHAMWQQMERTYLPWRRYGDLAWPAKGGLWQQQLHIYGAPFYYIDYTLAQTCALQIFLRASEDWQGAIDDYIALCHRGGEAPFQDLAVSAGLTSPFDPGCLEAVVDALRPLLRAA